jgi:hypothetical protein
VYADGSSWRHVAVTCDGQYTHIYFNGADVGNHNMMLDPAAARVAAMMPSPEPVPTNVGTAFAGRLAHLRIYDGALTPAEITRDMVEDEATAFSSSHPFEFSFVNGDLQPVLLIEDNPAGYPIALTLTNATRRDLTAVPGAAWHFSLRFRKGTLPANLNPKVTSPEWTMTVAQDRTELQLLWKPAKPVPPGGTTTVWIDGMNADGAEGTRGTRVELGYQNVAFVGDGPLPPGTRRQFLDVVNHRGRRDIPLDLRLVGGDRVPCDGRTGAGLKLQLTHMLTDGAGITLRAGAGGSELRVSFDVQRPGESRPWALTTSEQATAAVIAIEGAGWTLRPEPLGSRAQWTITPTADRILRPDEHLTFTFQRLYALASMGHAPILLEYRNIPGYADGTLVVQVERSPLVYTDTTVTLGTDLSPAGLQIVAPDANPGGKGLLIGSAAVTGLTLGKDQYGAWIQGPLGKPLRLNPSGGGVEVTTITTSVLRIGAVTLTEAELSRLKALLAKG